MTTFVHTLQTVDLEPHAIIRVNPPSRIKQLALNDPAIAVMTDLTHVRAITINTANTIDFANELMKYAGIRMLVVTDRAGILLGLITARDVLGEKPVSVMAREKIGRHEIEVRHIMTPFAELDPLHYSDVEHASIHQVIMNLRDAGRQHAIVIDELEDSSGQYLRGIFSATQIGRMLGIELSTAGHVQSFVEFEQLLA